MKGFLKVDIRLAERSEVGLIGGRRHGIPQSLQQEGYLGGGQLNLWQNRLTHLRLRTQGKPSGSGNIDLQMPAQISTQTLGDHGPIHHSLGLSRHALQKPDAQPGTQQSHQKYQGDD